MVSLSFALYESNTEAFGDYSIAPHDNNKYYLPAGVAGNTTLKYLLMRISYNKQTQQTTVLMRHKSKRLGIGPPHNQSNRYEQK